MADGAAVHHELILGGQKSGKSRLAVSRARAWLAGGPARSAVLVATAEAGDAEMRQRIERHRAERARELPGIRVVEEGRDLSAALAAHCSPDCLVVVDCLTLWLTQRLMPGQPGPGHPPSPASLIDELTATLRRAPGPVLLVSNEIGSGVVPMGAEVRAFVDAAGWMNQRVAECCDRVTWVVAGLPVVLKAAA